MTEIVLTVVIAVLCLLIGWLEYNNRKERKSLLNALQAKNAEELANLELVDKTKIEVQPEEQGEEDLVPINTLSDEDYEEHIING